MIPLAFAVGSHHFADAPDFQPALRRGILAEPSRSSGRNRPIVVLAAPRVRAMQSKVGPFALSRLATMRSPLWAKRR